MIAKGKDTLLFEREEYYWSWVMGETIINDVVMTFKSHEPILKPELNQLERYSNKFTIVGRTLRWMVNNLKLITLGDYDNPISYYKNIRIPILILSTEENNIHYATYYFSNYALQHNFTCKKLANQNKRRKDPEIYYE